MSSGGTITDEADEAGMGVGVKLRANGLDEEDAEEMVEAVVSVELLLSVLDCRDLRRKGIEGMR